jgi:hypothetical protein
MKTALVTTTINVPHVLRLYRRCDPDVKIFVALDQKSPFKELAKWGNDEGYSWLTPDFQKQWKCSDLIGWNCIQRRNLATLEALRWGADIIVFVDDDNIPIWPRHYFRDYQRAFAEPFDGLLAAPDIPWFDIGQHLVPPTSHRGFPHELAHRKSRLSHVVDAKIGVAAGLVMGDPDCSALTRIVARPHVTSMDAMSVFGIAVNPRFTRTVWNTQNSAVIRELAPAMLLCPQFRRYDDIIASLVCQRVMADTGHHVLFGPPFVYQERNIHSLSRDLADEAWGQEHLLDVQSLLWRTSTENLHTVAARVLRLYAAIDTLMPGVGELAEAWISDCERAMG